jgi:Zn-dependent protease with chaperone function
MEPRTKWAAGREFTIALIFAGLVVFPGGLWGTEKLEFKPGFNLFSIAQDVEMGKEASEQIDKQVPLLKDPETLEYLRGLERKLVSFAPDNHAEYVWQVKIVNRPEINSFALPGGYIYVNRGLLEAVENESQLAGALAHESGHVVMRHGTHMVTQTTLLQFPAAVLSGMLGQGGSLLSQLGQLGIGLSLDSLLLKNSRSAESQADEVGAYILYQAGYDPRALAKFFQVIEKKAPQRTVQFFSDHPNPENRIRDLDREIALLGSPRAGSIDSSQFEAVKQRVQALAPPPKAQGTPEISGREQPPPPPSEHLTRYESKAFALDYPDNWKVEQGEDEVAIFPPGGMITGAEGQTAQAYGAAISHFRPPAENWGLVDATGELVESMRQSNPQLHIVQQTGMNQHGSPAVSTLMQNASPLEGQRETDHLVTIRQGDYVLALIFIAPARAFESYASTFDKMLQSFEVPK